MFRQAGKKGGGHTKDESGLLSGTETLSTRKTQEVLKQWISLLQKEAEYSELCKILENRMTQYQASKFPPLKLLKINTLKELALPEDERGIPGGPLDERLLKKFGEILKQAEEALKKRAE